MVAKQVAIGEREREKREVSNEKQVGKSGERGV